MIAQHKAYRQDGYKTLDYLTEVIIGGVQDEVTGLVIRSHLGRKSAAEASAVYNQMIFGVLCSQPAVHELHVIQHFLFPSFSSAFTKAAVVHEYHVISIPVKILGIAGPSLDAAGIAMEIKNEPFW